MERQASDLSADSGGLRAIIKCTTMLDHAVPPRPLFSVPGSQTTMSDNDDETHAVAFAALLLPELLFVKDAARRKTTAMWCMAAWNLGCQPPSERKPAFAGTISNLPPDVRATTPDLDKRVTAFVRRKATAFPSLNLVIRRLEIDEDSAGLDHLRLDFDREPQDVPIRWFPSPKGLIDVRDEFRDIARNAEEFSDALSRPDAARSIGQRMRENLISYFELKRAELRSFQIMLQHWQATQPAASVQRVVNYHLEKIPELRAATGEILRIIRRQKRPTGASQGQPSQAEDKRRSSTRRDQYHSQTPQPQFFPIAQLPHFAEMVAAAFDEARGQAAVIEPARVRPHALDDATVQLIVDVFTGQRVLTEHVVEQLRRWENEATSPSQRLQVAAVTAQTTEWRSLINHVLAIAKQLASATIERQLAKSDVELALEFLARRTRGVPPNRT